MDWKEPTPQVEAGSEHWNYLRSSWVGMGKFRRAEMVMHSGHTMHQIAPTTTVQQSDARVTLQGHGVCVDRVWWIYW